MTKSLRTIEIDELMIGGHAFYKISGTWFQYKPIKGADKTQVQLVEPSIEIVTLIEIIIKNFEENE